MAETFKCMCGVERETLMQLRGHILGANKKEPGKHARNVAAGTVEVAVPEPYPPDPGPLATREIFPPPEGDMPSDFVLGELDELRSFFQTLRSEFDALKSQVGAASVVWADAVKPVPIDQEAVNLAQMDAILGIDQPGPLEKKEEAIVAAVAERIEAPMAESEIEAIPEKKGVPRGVFLIMAFVAVVGAVVLVITQM